MTIAERLIEKGKIEGKAEGKVEGEMEARIAIARTAFQRQLKFEDVQVLTGLPTDKLIKIQREILH